MSANDPSEHPHEIIIVKRGNHDEDEGHHGGVWKVAFADFMTAMMAFFLVLWIINSTTRETKTSLARYFNPIKLTESTPAKKGLTESKEQTEDYLATDKDEKAKQGDPIGDRTIPVEKADPHDKKNPKPSPPQPPQSVGGQPKESPASPANAQPSQPQASDASAPGAEPNPVRSDATPAETPPNPVDSKQDERQTARPQDGPQQAASPKSEDFRDPYDRRSLYAMRTPAQSQAATKKEAGRIEQDLARALGDEMAKLQGRIEVKADSEGVLISLNEGADFSMFAIGSWDPEPRLQKVLASIAQILKTRRGPIVVRGHTDARRYRGDGNDNWRLSSARAQTALQSLLRSGLDEARVDRVEGYASGKLKNASDPNAPENRRIEILLRREQG